MFWVRNRRRNTTHQSREVDHLALSSSLCQTGNASFPPAPTPRPDPLRPSRSDLASDRRRRFSGVGWPRIDCVHRVGVRAAGSTETIGSPASSVADGDYLCSERQGRHGREGEVAWGATSKASLSTIVESTTSPLDQMLLTNGFLGRIKRPDHRGSDVFPFCPAASARRQVSTAPQGRDGESGSYRSSMHVLTASIYRRSPPSLRQHGKIVFSRNRPENTLLIPTL
jgi:hypothetical protein